MVYLYLQPISIVEGFRETMHAAEPRYFLPTWRTIRTKILPGLYNSAVTVLKAKLAKYEETRREHALFSVTTDCWTANNTTVLGYNFYWCNHSTTKLILPLFCVVHDVLNHYNYLCFLLWNLATTSCDWISGQSVLRQYILSGALRLVDLSSISSVFYSLPFQWMQIKLMIWWSYHVLWRFWGPGDRPYLKVTHRDNYLSLYVTMTRDNHVFCPGFTNYSIICQSITQLNTKGRFWSGFSFKW